MWFWLSIFACRNTIMGNWVAYSHNKLELPVSNCEREICDGMQDLHLKWMKHCRRLPTGSDGGQRVLHLYVSVNGSTYQAQ